MQGTWNCYRIVSLLKWQYSIFSMLLQSFVSMSCFNVPYTPTCPFILRTIDCGSVFSFYQPFNCTIPTQLLPSQIQTTPNIFLSVLYSFFWMEAFIGKCHVTESAKKQWGHLRNIQKNRNISQNTSIFHMELAIFFSSLLRSTEKKIFKLIRVCKKSQGGPENHSWNASFFFMRNLAISFGCLIWSTEKSKQVNWSVCQTIVRTSENHSEKTHHFSSSSSEEHFRECTIFPYGNCPGPSALWFAQGRKTCKSVNSLQVWTVVLVFPQDSTLAAMLLRPGPLPAILSAQFSETSDIDKVPRVYIKTMHDNVVKPAQQEAMIKRWPPSDVYVLESDHSPFFSTPFLLFGLLVKAAASVGCH